MIVEFELILMNSVENLFLFTESPDRVETLNGLGNLNGLNGLNGLNNLSGLGALEMQRNLALWQMYNNVNPSSSNNAPSPRSIEPQRYVLNNFAPKPRKNKIQLNNYDCSRFS